MTNTPLLSIVSITYNHEAYIAKTIEGVMMQQVNFPIEFIIAEDCSTDNTRKIVLDYANQYPELIKVITSKNNVGAVANEHRAMLAARGKYIAFCEGDDYWTDPLKLQKQVDFLESHTDYSVCFHRCRHYNVENDTWKDDGCGYLFKGTDVAGVNITSEMFLSKWITQPLTMVYRRDAFDLDIVKQYKYYRDMHQIYHLLKSGKGYLFAFEGGIYNLHRNGIHSKVTLLKDCQVAQQIATELYDFNRNDIVLKNYYIDTLQWSIYEYCGRLKNKSKAFILTFELFFLQRNLRRLGANIKRVLK